MEKNEVKKYLYRNRELMAKFSHYVSGNLYYTIQMEDGVYQFPISTIDKVELDKCLRLLIRMNLSNCRKFRIFVRWLRRSTG